MEKASCNSRSPGTGSRPRPSRCSAGRTGRTTRWRSPPAQAQAGVGDGVDEVAVELKDEWGSTDTDPLVRPDRDVLDDDTPAAVVV